MVSRGQTRLRYTDGIFRMAPDVPRASGAMSLD